MKAIQLESPGQLRSIDVEPPGPPGPGEARVRVHRVGVCGTDISGYLGKMPFFSYPRIPGHELGVEILELGAGVEDLKVGEQCSVEPYMNCGNCRACRRGRPNCCANLQVIGVHIDGGLRREIVVPARKLHPSGKLSHEQLALVETLVIGRHAVGRAQIEADDRCLIVGAGPIGLAVVASAKLSCTDLTVLDLSEQRLGFSHDVMGTKSILGGEGVDERVRDASQNEGFDVVIDATGHAGSMSKALEFVAHSGRLVYVGITTDEVQFEHRTLHAPEITLLASRNALPDDFRTVIAAIEDGRLDTDPWITHRVPLEGLVEALPQYAKPETGVVKAMVEVD